MQPRKRIGDRLIEEGLITEDQLKAALVEQKKTGELLGSILFSLGYISQKDLFKVLSASAEQHAPADAPGQGSNFTEEIDFLVRQSRSLHLRDGDGARQELDSPHSPLVNLVEKILNEGVRRRATDVHVNPDAKGVRIRYRVDGVLQHGMFLPGELLAAIVSRIKVLGHMNIAESRVPQDGGATHHIRGRELDLRISTFPVLGGENVVIRILDKSQIRVGLESLGFAEGDIERVGATLRLPHGMILVTGPTGSGKTTTLYSCLSVINTVNRNIFTIEDPVEYQLPLARQSQVNIRAGLTFANGLRSILRQDPDVILIGEMRDAETAELAVRAALTGHLVFSTLHTNDALSSITRLVDIGIDPFLLTSTLDTIIAQRLVRLLCLDCRQPLAAENPLYGRLGTSAGSHTLYRPQGCPACAETGYRGRTVVYEILKMSKSLRELVNRRASLDELRQAAAREGFQGMFEAGRNKVLAGVTSYEEVGSVIRVME